MKKFLKYFLLALVASAVAYTVRAEELDWNWQFKVVMFDRIRPGSLDPSWCGWTHMAVWNLFIAWWYYTYEWKRPHRLW